MSSVLGSIIGAVGTGMSIFEGLKMRGTEKEIGQEQMQLGNEEQANISLQRQQQQLDYTRQSRAIARNAIQTSAQSKAAAVTSGAQFGSGEGGGQAQIKSTAGTQQTGLNQNFALGQQALALSSQEIGTASEIGQLQSTAAGEQSIMSMWSAVTGASQSIGNSMTSAGGAVSNWMTPAASGAGEAAEGMDAAQAGAEAVLG